MGSISRDDVIEILKTLNESQIEEFHLETGDVKLVVKKEGNTKSFEHAGWINEIPPPPAVTEKPVPTEKTRGVEASSMQSLRKDLQTRSQSL